MNIITRFRAMPAGDIDPAAAVIIEPGTRADYQHLAAHHYRRAHPATAALILRAIAPSPSRHTIGVLVVSMPALNAPWRCRLWPDLFAHADKRRAAAVANRHVRTISRVIVDPRWRGLGIARRLVLASLQRPLTRITEARAAMGACSPFFAAAGMSAHRIDPPAHAARLARRLARARIQPWRLIDPYAARRLLARHAWLAPELRRWANASRATRACADAPALRLAALAAAALSAPPVVYVWRRT